MEETLEVQVTGLLWDSVSGGSWGVEGDEAGNVCRCHPEGLLREMGREGRKESWGNKMLLGSAWGERGSGGGET